MPLRRPKFVAQTLLLLTALVWGASFVLVKTALDHASPLLFNLLRMTLAAAILAALNAQALRRMTRAQAAAGALAGCFLAAGYQLQTLGLARTTASKSGFLTGLVVVFVPMLSLLPGVRPRHTRRPGLSVAFGALAAFAGLVLLTTPAGTTPANIVTAIHPGDLLTLACALAFAAHMLTLARVSGGIEPGVLATMQIATAALLMLVTLPLEPDRFLHWTPGLIAALAITSVFATAAAFTIQSFAQQHLPATHTAVILSLEPVFAALTSVLFLGERLGLRSLAGAFLILLAIALIELPSAASHTTEIPA